MFKRQLEIVAFLKMVKILYITVLHILILSLLTSCWCVFIDDRWGDVPTYSGRGWREHELPSISSTWKATGYWARSVWSASRLKHVRHPVAAWAQPCVWHPKERASHLGRWATLSDHQTYYYRWSHAMIFCCRAALLEANLNQKLMLWQSDLDFYINF